MIHTFDCQGAARIAETSVSSPGQTVSPPRTTVSGLTWKAARPSGLSASAALGIVRGMRTRDAAWLPLILWGLACGGPAAPPASPETVADASDAKAPATGDADAAPVNSDSPASDKPSSSSPASDQDVTAILQLVVDDPELDRYLHLAEPGRFPLQISGEHLPSGMKLVKATEPVKVVAGPKSKKDAVLMITEIDVHGDKATVRYRYDVEGIRGNVTLAKVAHGWELKNSRLVEH